MPPKEPGDPKAEIARLRAKLATIQDRDIRAAIQERVDALASQVVESGAPLPSGGEEAEPPKEPPPPPTPEQAERAERLVRQAMLEKQRGNKAAVTKLLQEAVEVAPGAPTTLEALGDDLASRSRTKEALDCYKRAMELDPKNVGLERKHANLVFNVGTAGSIEEQMRANLSDSPFLTQGDAVASFGTARLITYLFPGLGHLVLGRTAAGLGFLGAWVACLVWAGIILAGSNRNGRLYFTMALAPPVVIALFVLLVAVASLGGGRAAARSKSTPARPKPPVDLPFD